MSCYLFPTKNTRNEIDRAMRHWDVTNPDAIDVQVLHYRYTTYFSVRFHNQVWDVMIVRRKLSPAQEFDRLEAIRFYIDNRLAAILERSN